MTGIALLFLPVLGMAIAQGQKVVSRAMFTTKVENREPINRVLILDNTVTEVFFFTELKQMQGRTITHRWEYNGKVMSKKTFQVKGPRWRVYSSRELDPEMVGKWTVVVLDDKGWPLKAVVFEYVNRDASNARAVILPSE